MEELRPTISRARIHRTDVRKRNFRCCIVPLDYRRLDYAGEYVLVRVNFIRYVRFSSYSRAALYRRAREDARM